MGYARTMSMGDRIRQAREQAGYTQEGLARKLDVSKNTVARWESGRDLRAEENLAPLVDALGVSADWLVIGADAPETDPPFFAEFRAAYDRMGRLTAEQIDWLRDAYFRGGARFTSAEDWARFADDLVRATAKPSAIHEKAIAGEDEGE